MFGGPLYEAQQPDLENQTATEPIDYYEHSPHAGHDHHNSHHFERRGMLSFTCNICCKFSTYGFEIKDGKVLFIYSLRFAFHFCQLYLGLTSHKKLTIVKIALMNKTCNNQKLLLVTES